METKYKNIFKPLRIRGVMLKNRIFTGPSGVPKAIVLSSTDYGNISLFDRSRGGAAVVCCPMGYLSAPAGYEEVKYVNGEKTVDRGPFSKYARDITREALSVNKQSGSLVAAQIGPMLPRDKDGMIVSIADGTTIQGYPCRAATKEELKTAIRKCAEEMVKAKNFGFDIGWIHIGHDGLASYFLSKKNTRTDESGGSLDNRCRFAVELCKAVREAVGPDFPLMTRLGRTWGPVPESWEEDDMVYLIKQLSPYIDVVNASNAGDTYGGTIDKYEANVHANSTVFEPRYYNLEFAARLKREIPGLIVILNGGVGGTGAEAVQYVDDIIAKGYVDGVMMVRQMYADPFWPKKAMEGKEEDIVPCIRCLNCYHISTVHANTQCSVNPRYRRENRVPLKLEKTDDPKKVVVIGGGPAGLKAALTADEKGHKVTLLEKEGRLGGMINVSDHGKYKKDLRSYRDYLLVQISKSNVEVRLNTPATPELIKALNPDVLLVCIGAEVIRPNIPGIENARQVVDSLSEAEQLTGKIAIIGGGTVGSEFALEIAENGKDNDVTIIELGSVISEKENWLYRKAQQQHMNKCQNLHVLLETKCTEIRKDGVVVIDKNGNESLVSADHIFVAVGMRSKKEEAFSFYGITPETNMIGDCLRVGHVLDCTNEAYFVASNL